MALDLQQFREVSDAVGVRGALVEINQRTHGVHEEASGGVSLVGHDDKMLEELQEKLDLEAKVQKINFRKQDTYLFQENTLQKIQRPGGFAYRYVVRVKAGQAEVRDLSEEEALALLHEFPTLKLLLIQHERQLPAWLGWFERVGNKVIDLVPLLGTDETSDSKFVALILGSGVFLVVIMIGIWLWVG